MARLNISMKDEIVSAGKILAGLEGTSLSGLLEKLIKDSFDKNKINKTASDVSDRINAGGKDIS